jgi:hypothetical protein
LEKTTETLNLLKQHIGGSNALNVFARHLDAAIIVPASYPSRVTPGGNLARWCQDDPHLLVLQDDDIGRLCFVLFRVLHYHAQQRHGLVQELVIDVIACTDSAINGEHQVVMEIIRPEADEGIHYRHKFHDVFGHSFDSIEVFLSEMIAKNDGFIEAVVNRIALIGHVLCAGVQQ